MRTARPTGRPPKAMPSRRVYLTLDAPDHDLLEAYARQSNRPLANVAVQLLLDTLRSGLDEDGRIDRAVIDANLRTLRGEDVPVERGPRWTWPIGALLADRQWWDRWLPHLNELLGRKLREPTKPGGPSRAGYGERQSASEPRLVVDQRGFADLMEFLFPTLTTDQGDVSWRSIDYPKLMGPAAPIWEAVIRHVATALASLEQSSEPKADPRYRFILEDELTGAWLRTLTYLIGQDQPEATPTRRLV
jgi:hypothetical protein